MLSTAQTVQLQRFNKAKLFLFPPDSHERFSLAEGCPFFIGILQV